MTKYCEMVIEPAKIKYCLEKALFLAQTGRPGPCWLDIPLNVQGAYIDIEDLEKYNFDYNVEYNTNISDDIIETIIEKIEKSERPVVYAGNGIRIAGAFDVFSKVIEKLNVPVVTGWNSIDTIYDDHPLYVGRGGIMGDRAGNFAVQNSDLVLSLGSRLSIRQVGYNYKTWAREAFTIVVDIDENELKKPTLRIDLPICADVKVVLEMLKSKLENKPCGKKEKWHQTCTNWKYKYPVVMKKHYEDTDCTNVYCFTKELSNYLPEDYITVVGNGSACVVGSHAYTIKKGQRFIINSAIASMGYDLPASIGACIRNNFV